METQKQVLVTGRPPTRPLSVWNGLNGDRVSDALNSNSMWRDNPYVGGDKNYRIGVAELAHIVTLLHTQHQRVSLVDLS